MYVRVVVQRPQNGPGSAKAVANGILLLRKLKWWAKIKA